MATHTSLGVTVDERGAHFGVWAPFAEAVAVSGSFNSWGEIPLQSEQNGHWWGFVEGARAGQE